MRIKMPAVRIAQANSDMPQHQDILTCGVCHKIFALGDIVKFIQHKVLTCNKENYGLGSPCNNDAADGGNSGDDANLISIRRTNIAGPMRKWSPPPNSVDETEPRCSTPKRRSGPTPHSPSGTTTPIRPDMIKQEEVDSSALLSSSQDDGSCKKLRTDTVDAQSNTTNSEPSNYVCSTCKARMHSAWKLVQHVQNNHGIKIYIESSSPGSSPPNKVANSSSSSSSSGCSSGNTNGGTPLSLSSRLGLPTSTPLIDSHLPPVHNPFAVMARLPLEPPRPHPFQGAGLFGRPDFQLVNLGQHSGLSLPVPQAPFVERPLPPTTRPPTLPLTLDPHLDFYSQRLRQLAGTTSPGTAPSNSNSSLSPRKLSPPFTSPTTNIAVQLITNNNNLITNNNINITNTLNNNHNSPLRAESSTPPEKNNQNNENAPETVDLTSTPRSFSTPPDNEKPADFSISGISNNNVDNEKLHSCEYCGKKFKYHSSLLAHQKAHTGDKDKLFKCTVCNHTCSQSSKLKKHMKLHKRKKSGGSDELTSGINGSGSTNSDQMSNGSVETEDDEDDEDLEEDDDDEEEDEEEDMELEEEDEDDDGDAPEDLTTKSASSTPPNVTETSKGNSSPKPTHIDKMPSVVGELMDKFGLSNIQQYSEAYKAALQESHHISRKDDLLHRSLINDNNNSMKPRLENGLLEKSAALKFREFAKLSGQPPMDLMHHSLFGNSAPFDNPFDASKRLKLDSKESHLTRHNERDLYANLWLPAMAAAHHRDSMFGTNGSESLIDKSKNEVNPGTSTSLAAAAAAALNLGIPIKKERGRNDTCEYCGKVFKNCSNLTVHRRSHTGEKPYKCDLCAYACAQSSKLTRHMKTHGRHGKDVYRCRFCNMPFSVPSTLEKHMRKCVVSQKGELILPITSVEDNSNASKEAT